MSKKELGFGYRVQSSGNVEITFHGRLVTTLSKGTAQVFLAKVAALDDEGAQQLMARATGNFKRGNERGAKRHPRNSN